jgi:aminocarboxymuconate-semialdehyde decarboxylase
MMAIDLHAHLAPAAALEHFGWLSRESNVLRVLVGDRWQAVPPALLDAGALLVDADDTGITVRVASPPPFLLRYDLPSNDAGDYCRAMNEALAEAAAPARDRLRILAAVPLQDPVQAARELTRAVEDLGCVGAAIATSVAGRVELDAPELRPFWSAAEALDALVFIHPHDVAGEGRMHAYHLRNLVGNPLETTLAAARLIFGGVLAQHPRLQVLLAHGGGTLPWLFGRFDRGFEVRPECRTIDGPPSGWAGRFLYDTVLFDHQTVRGLVDRVGAGRVVLGTDFPFDMGDPDAVGTVSRALDEPRMRHAVLSGNAARVLSAGRRPPRSVTAIRDPHARGGGLS